MQGMTYLLGPVLYPRPSSTPSRVASKPPQSRALRGVTNPIPGRYQERQATGHGIGLLTESYSLKFQAVLSTSRDFCLSLKSIQTDLETQPIIDRRSCSMDSSPCWRPPFSRSLREISRSRRQLPSLKRSLSPSKVPSEVGVSWKF